MKKVAAGPGSTDLEPGAIDPAAESRQNNSRMGIVQAVIFGLLGAAFGSFLNVCVDRLPAGRSLLRPPSHCDGCGRRLTAAELIPVFSYLALRGRCRTCGVKVPLRVLLVELGCGLFLGWLIWSRGLTPESGIIALYAFIFAAVALIDLKHQIIPNRIVYPSLVLALALAPLFIHAGQGGTAAQGL